MYHVGEGTRPCPFPAMGNGNGQVTEPKGEHFSGRNLGMIPTVADSIVMDRRKIGSIWWGTRFSIASAHIGPKIMTIQYEPV